MSGKKIKLSLKLLALPLLAMSMSSAFADPAVGPSGKLTVTGEYTPPPCTVALAANGTIDYGHISTASLHTTYSTNLPIKTLANAVTITCASATNVAINWDDNRYSSLAVDVLDSVGRYKQLEPSGHATGFGLNLGLGNDSLGRHIGNYVATLSALKIDGVSQFFADTATVPFQKDSAAPTSVMEYMGTRAPFAFNFLDSNGDLVSGKVFTMDYNVLATVTQANSLDLSKEIVLDGSSTISVYYL
ncbi:MAG: DUF1120 domain-containing protein [Hafnia alvei]|uniref:DUF1120 domain-containing protein n=1 Tax=Hafnia alvei TaxID=569 RepID=UPI001034EC93|nr:DUF1120 domain-containing protein [Hafnia alvei]KAA0261280.1 DUF1120 domain-containing protein [Hafnia alvei]TBL83623.1 DUF1120 domain-containing protein [Hafnia alvei]